MNRLPKTIFFVMFDVIIGAFAIFFIFGVVATVAFIVSQAPMVVFEGICACLALGLIGHAVRSILWELN